MLTRQANHLFWLARYIERLENMARVLNVAHDNSLLPGGDRSSVNWHLPLEMMGIMSDYLEIYPTVTTQQVLSFMISHESNPSSVYSCIKNARFNARAVRGVITKEMWESLNLTWLESDIERLEGMSTSQATAYLAWVSERSYLFRGVVSSTQLHDDAYRIMRIGNFLERADFTTRILDEEFQFLRQSQAENPEHIDFYQCSGILRAVSAFAAYRNRHSGRITPDSVVAFLVQEPKLPRSLLFCVDQIQAHMNKLKLEYAPNSYRSIGKLQSGLFYADMDQVLADDFHAFLDQFMSDLSAFHEHVYEELLT